MRTERVFTNHRCNQNCTYCTFRRAEDDLGAIQLDAVMKAIDLATSRGATEILLTGGEPTLRGDLPQLVHHAARQVSVVGLETNATLLDASLAKTLREAGLKRATVNLAGASRALDSVTRDPGGFERTVRGIEALTTAEVEVEIQAAVVRSTLPWLSALPPHAQAVGATALVLAVPTSSPDPSEVLDWEESTRAVQEVLRGARLIGLPLRLSSDAAPPPCAFPNGSRVESLYGSLAPDLRERAGYRHVESCRACLVQAGCPGIAESTLAQNSHPPIHPIEEERARRRLTLVSSVEDQVRRELVSRSIRGPATESGEGGSTVESVIRVHFHCNQSCTFCFVSTHLPPASDREIESAILDAARSGSKVVLSGGEPTLSPRLADWVRLAKSHSTFPVQIQTNATSLKDPSLVRHLVEAGLDEAFVSLHGATAEVSDRVTEAPGTFVRTLLGIDELAKTKVLVILNFVLCQANYREAPSFVGLVAKRWPQALVNFSFVAPSSDLVPRTRDLIPRYSDVLPYLERAIEAAHARKLSVVGLESMCGLPLCLIPKSVRGLALTDIPEGFDAGEFVKGSACEACTKKTHCYGLRRGYRSMYGDAELRPFSSSADPS